MAVEGWGEGGPGSIPLKTARNQIRKALVLWRDAWRLPTSGKAAGVIARPRPAAPAKIVETGGVSGGQKVIVTGQ